MTDAAKWVATLSDGTTAAEYTGEWQIIPGERKPWVRLCQYALDNDLHITSLRLNFKGRTIHLPRNNFGRFTLDSRAPLLYSVMYIAEGELPVSGNIEQHNYIDLAAHYDKFDVHFVQDIDDGNTSWVVVTDPGEPLAKVAAYGN